jgi:hypothetical protein
MDSFLVVCYNTKNRKTKMHTKHNRSESNYTLLFPSRPVYREDPGSGDQKVTPQTQAASGPSESREEVFSIPPNAKAQPPTSSDVNIDTLKLEMRNGAMQWIDPHKEAAEVEAANVRKVEMEAERARVADIKKQWEVLLSGLSGTSPRSLLDALLDRTGVFETKRRVS